MVREDGALRGVEAVLDKDLTGALLARTVGADCFLIATDVEAAAIGFGTPRPGVARRGARPSGCATCTPVVSSPAAAWSRRCAPRCRSRTPAAAP